ncbi:uncharacterized protein DUF2851 [Ulvibacter sp. MAR_2010_11]|uniref:DUF2851 family protein n=1 Tax=Ulvibacter sp. MAR_2010_11 TaxID=1250229 RepID=UPI000C2C394A|nr:DUF2851 family protein [Ulvibacter sp. MAR_2010_11]PKA83645.1 uncharacterized protein DUF2851 [Ulvibacter sp. MAR_2010_11]
MKEDFLHYVWKFQKFDTRELSTVHGETIKVLKPGMHNLNSGPDFFNAQIAIGDVLWNGNVEIHINASHWYQHSHESDPAYDSVILHVVWEHDAEVFRQNNTVIPTLQLKNCVEKSTLTAYHKLFSKELRWINCENEFPKVDTFLLQNWLERLYVERLELKAQIIQTQLKSLHNHWEALLFRMLCKNFGLSVNGEAFLSLAGSIDFSIIQKVASKSVELEALLLGQAGLLEGDCADEYSSELQRKYRFLKNKFKVSNEGVIAPKFFRLRPSNFPTLRLSQLAMLYGSRRKLFSEIISANNLSAIYTIFNISASSYWDTHYNFGVTSKKNSKVLTKSCIDLIVINTIIPFQFCYANYLGKNNCEAILQLASEIASEKNSIISKFSTLGFTSGNAMQSQALLQLKNNYCNVKRCLECAVGNSILKGS